MFLTFYFYTVLDLFRFFSHFTVVLPNLRSLTLDQILNQPYPLLATEVYPNFLRFLPSLTKFKVLYTQNDKLLENLSYLTSLEKLVIIPECIYIPSFFESTFGINLKRVIENLPKLVYIKIPPFDFLQKYEIQTRYPSIPFRW